MRENNEACKKTEKVVTNRIQGPLVSYVKEKPHLLLPLNIFHVARGNHRGLLPLPDGVAGRNVYLSTQKSPFGAFPGGDLQVPVCTPDLANS